MLASWIIIIYIGISDDTFFSRLQNRLYTQMYAVLWYVCHVKTSDDVLFIYLGRIDAYSYGTRSGTPIDNNFPSIRHNNNNTIYLFKENYNFSFFSSLLFSVVQIYFILLFIVAFLFIYIFYGELTNPHLFFVRPSVVRVLRYAISLLSRK